MLRLKKRNTGVKATEIEILDHGVDHSQYFQGCGVAFSKFEACYTGIGEDFSEALEDALEQCAQSGEYNHDSIEKLVKEELKGREKEIANSPTVEDVIRDNLEDPEDDAEYEEAVQESELHYHVSIRVR